MKYSGLVLGGAGAGQFMSMPDPHLSMTTKPSFLSAYQLDDLSSISAEMPISHYRHETYRYIDDTGKETVFGFWVPIDEKHPRRYVIEELSRAYQNGAKK